MLKLWERKAEGEGKGKTHQPGVNGDKGGGVGVWGEWGEWAQPQRDESAWRASDQGHLHKAQLPQAAHLQGLHRFPATLLHKRCVSAQTHTRGVETAEAERRLEGEVVSAHHWLAIVSGTHRFPDPCSNNWPGRPPVCMCAGILLALSPTLMEN